MAWDISSSVFEDQGNIPQKYTCQGEDVSPPLSWGAAPEGTESIALICDDPDAPMGTWVHWVLWNLPADTVSLEENIPKTASTTNGAEQGTTDFGRVGYGGPCPPPGNAHRYFFKLYALDTKINLSSKATKRDLLSAMEGHVKEETALVGKYQRK